MPVWRPAWRRPGAAGGSIAGGRSQLEPDETVATLYAFHHELYREVIYEQLSAGRRGLLHRRAGQHLETVHAGRTDASAAALAVHVEQRYHPPQVSRPYRLAH